MRCSNDGAPIPAGDRGAAKIANLGGLRANSSTPGRNLTLIVSDGRRVACRLQVRAERCGTGWSFAGYVPGRVLR